MGRDDSLGSARWRAYVFCLTLLTGGFAVVGLCTAAAFKYANKHTRPWPESIRRFLTGTIGPRLVRFFDAEMFLSLARWRCRLTGRLAHRTPRLGGAVYRYFNLAVLLGLLSVAASLLLLTAALV